jgi:large conductance mechanosensitive channel
VVSVHNSKILYGLFINAVISFLLIAIGVYFFIVAPMNHFEKMRRRRRGLPEAVPEVTEIELLTQIRDSLATRD